MRSGQHLSFKVVEAKGLGHLACDVVSVSCEEDKALGAQGAETFKGLGGLGARRVGQLEPTQHFLSPGCVDGDANWRGVGRDGEAFGGQPAGASQAKETVLGLCLDALSSLFSELSWRSGLDASRACCRHRCPRDRVE